MTSTQSKPPQNGRILKRHIYRLLFHWSQSSSPAFSYPPRGMRVLSRIIQNYSYDWLFCHGIEISDPCWIAWVSGVSEGGGGGGEGKKRSKSGDSEGRKNCSLSSSFLLSLAPKEGHILKLDSTFTVAALELFYCSRNLCIRSVQVNECSCFSNYSSQVSVYKICSIIVSLSLN